MQATVMKSSSLANARCLRSVAVPTYTRTTIASPGMPRLRPAQLLQAGSEASTSAPHRAVAAKAFNNRGDDAGDRIIASLPYLLPLLDAFPFGEVMCVLHLLRTRQHSCWATNN